MSVARIVVVSALEARLFAPYDLRELIKSFPPGERKWSPTERCWLLIPWAVDAMADALRAAGCTVYVTRPDGTPYDKPGAPGGHGRRNKPGADWARTLLDAVGAERQDRVYKALSRVLHPDLEGGSTALMQQLNDARDRSKQR